VALKERILIVDDEEQVRTLLCQKLSAEGYECHVATRADEALDKMRRLIPAQMILDIKMPGKSGFEILPEIQTSHLDTAVIMATATTDSEIAIRCMKQGAYDYIIKPFDLDEVSISVDRALHKRRLELENRESGTWNKRWRSRPGKSAPPFSMP
jgi:DNA-binding NtrC family response regulator